MSDHIASIGVLLSNLGRGVNPVTDREWMRLAASEELTELIRGSIKRIVGDQQAREQEAHANRQSVLNGSIAKIATIGSHVVIEKSVIDKLKANGLPGSVTVVRELVKLNREDLRERELTNEEILHLEVALRAVGLHLAI